MKRETRAFVLFRYTGCISTLRYIIIAEARELAGGLRDFPRCSRVFLKKHVRGFTSARRLNSSLPLDGGSTISGLFQIPDASRAEVHNFYRPRVVRFFFAVSCRNERRRSRPPNWRFKGIPFAAGCGYAASERIAAMNTITSALYIFLYGKWQR